MLASLHELAKHNTRKKIEKLIRGRGRTFIRHSRVGTKFRLKMTLLNFWIKLTQRVFPSKKNKNYHRILHIQINLDSKFQLQKRIWIFGTNFKRSKLSVENTKNEHQY